MSDESEIPDDIEKAARKLLLDTRFAHDGAHHFRLLAEALLSERRQCADIAYDAALYSGCPADFIAEEIAEAVRNGRRQQ